MTQAPAKHQVTVHGVLGIPMHKVVVHTKRIGGGFGGKESRPAFVNAAIAVPAWHLRRPVRIVLDRDEDMHIMGQRHAFLGRYKARNPAVTPSCWQMHHSLLPNASASLPCPSCSDRCPSYSILSKSNIDLGKPALLSQSFGLWLVTLRAAHAARVDSQSELD